MFYYNLC